MKRQRRFKSHWKGLRIHGGFTLIEDLVVIAIIAILIGTIFPRIDRYKSEASRQLNPFSQANQRITIR